MNPTPSLAENFDRRLFFTVSFQRIFCHGLIAKTYRKQNKYTRRVQILRPKAKRLRRERFVSCRTTHAIAIVYNVFGHPPTRSIAKSTTGVWYTHDARVTEDLPFSKCEPPRTSYVCCSFHNRLFSVVFATSRKADDVNFTNHEASERISFFFLLNFSLHNG